MKKLWLSALTAVTLLAGMSFGTAAWAGGRHDHWHGRDRHERCDDRRGWSHHGHGHYKHGHHKHGHYRPHREIREVYYVPAPRYYRPERVYYGGGRPYYRDRDGVSGSITVDF